MKAKRNFWNEFLTPTNIKTISSYHWVKERIVRIFMESASIDGNMPNSLCEEKEDSLQQSNLPSRYSKISLASPPPLNVLFYNNGSSKTFIWAHRHSPDTSIAILLIICQNFSLDSHCWLSFDEQMINQFNGTLMRSETSLEWVRLLWIKWLWLLLIDFSYSCFPLFSICFGYMKHIEIPLTISQTGHAH